MRKRNLFRSILNTPNELALLQLSLQYMLNFPTLFIVFYKISLLMLSSVDCCVQFAKGWGQMIMQIYCRMFTKIDFPILRLSYDLFLRTNARFCIKELDCPLFVKDSTRLNILNKYIVWINLKVGSSRGQVDFFPWKWVRSLQNLKFHNLVFRTFGLNFSCKNSEP